MSFLFSNHSCVAVRVHRVKNKGVMSRFFMIWQSSFLRALDLKYCKVFFCLMVPYIRMNACKSLTYSSCNGIRCKGIDTLSVRPREPHFWIRRFCRVIIRFISCIGQKQKNSFKNKNKFRFVPSNLSEPAHFHALTNLQTINIYLGVFSNHQSDMFSYWGAHIWNQTGFVGLYP